MTRRSFLTRLALLAAAPGAVIRALKAEPAQPVPGALVAPSLRWHYNQPLLSREANRAYIWQCVRAIKVPSNRFYTEDRDSIRREGYHPGHNAYHAYVGDWDGTFKVEPCSNPAYVLADLIECDFTDILGGSTNWVLSDHNGDLNWRALYDYGVYCDELVIDLETERLNVRWTGGTPADNFYWTPRFTIDTMITTEAQRANLKNDLRMHFLCWRAEDERHRSSWPV